MRYELGKLAAVRPHGLKDLTVYAKGKLPAPPQTVSAPDILAWGMDGNDEYGDCTIAGVDHLIKAWNFDSKDATPNTTTTEIVKTYMTLTGGQDTGLAEATVLALWQKTGLFGNEIKGYAPIDPHDITALHQSIAFYGGAYLGVQLPKSAQTQFNSGEPWTVIPDSPIEGGHCIVAVSYTSEYVYVVTWGSVIPVSYPWLHKYMDEAWCVLPSEFQANAPEITFTTLLDDLESV